MSDVITQTLFILSGVWIVLNIVYWIHSIILKFVVKSIPERRRKLIKTTIRMNFVYALLFIAIGVLLI